MKLEALEVAMIEATRFLDKAHEARKRLDKDWQIDKEQLNLSNKRFYKNISKENATCLRASMDLTRALSELRKS